MYIPDFAARTISSPLPGLAGKYAGPIDWLGGYRKYLATSPASDLASGRGRNVTTEAGTQKRMDGQKQLDYLKLAVVGMDEM